MGLSESLRLRLIEPADRLRASDPGLSRLRTAAAGVVGVGSTLLVEAGLGRILGAGQGVLVMMLLGAVVAMMGSMALAGQRPWPTIRTGIFFPVAVGAGMVGGILVGTHTDLMLTGFVLVMFVDVFVRRFGRAFFFYGFMAWMGYFFAAFLHASWSLLPLLLLAVAVATVWMILLALTALRQSPRRTLRSTLRAFDARMRDVARACADLLEARGGDATRLRRRHLRLLSRQAALAEAALMVEGWSQDPGALPQDWSAYALRRRLIDAQHLLDRLASTTVALVPAAPELGDAALRVLDSIAVRDRTGARIAAEALLAHTTDPDVHGGLAVDTEGRGAARHLARAALASLDLAERAERPQHTPTDEEFSPTAALAMGFLPGSAAAFRDVAARGSAWNPIARLGMTTRQAIQVAIAGTLAILIGRELSPVRYYWAVIASFVMFTGTATRTESFRKAVNRVIGTMAGLVVAIVLANLTAGHTAWVLVVILASVFCGFYLVRVSYAYMIFFITIMVGQLYSVLNEFSSSLLVLRLEETALGAAAGIAVALVVLPLSNRDAVRAGRDNLVRALADLLEAVAAVLDPEGDERGTGQDEEQHDEEQQDEEQQDEDEEDGPSDDLDALSRALDDRARQLALVARPLVGPLPWGMGGLGTRHRLDLYYALAIRCRGLVVGVRAAELEQPLPAARVCRALAQAATTLTDVAPGQHQPEAEDPLARADELIVRDPATRVPGLGPDAAVLRPLVHIHDLLADLAAGPARPWPPSSQTGGGPQQSVQEAGQEHLPQSR